MRGSLLAALLLLALAAPFASVQGVSADEALVEVPGSLRIGDPFTVVVRVDVPAGAAVDLVPEAAGWGDVEVIRVLSTAREPLPDGERLTIVAEAAAFAPGQVTFAPVVAVASVDGVEVRTLPPASVAVVPTLREGEPLELRPLPPPVSIGSGRSWVRPAAAGAAVLVAAAVVTTAAWRRRRRASPTPEPEGGIAPVPLPQLEAVAKLLEENPVAGYRELGAAVRRVLEEQYRFPARALTTTELRSRMEAEGVDRWQARLVAGLLEECDAVVYAGYRPAPERRRADLSMAAEILAAAEVR